MCFCHWKSILSIQNCCQRWCNYFTYRSQFHIWLEFASKNTRITTYYYLTWKNVQWKSKCSIYRFHWFRVIFVDFFLISVIKLWIVNWINKTQIHFHYLIAFNWYNNYFVYCSIGCVCVCVYISFSLIFFSLYVYVCVCRTLIYRIVCKFIHKF